MNIVYGLFLLAGYTYCGIVPTFLGFVTWLGAGKILEHRFDSARKADAAALAVAVIVAVIAAFIMKKFVFPVGSV